MAKILKNEIRLKSISRNIHFDELKKDTRRDAWYKDNFPAD